MLTELLLLLLGLFLLVKGSGLFVRAAANIAKRFGVSELVIGLTVVAIGTSLPELVSSAIAAAQGQSGLVIGTLTGANIANIALIIGLASLVKPLRTKREMRYRDGYVMVALFFLFLLFLFDRTVSRFEGIVLLLYFAGYILFLSEHGQRFAGFRHYLLGFGFLATLRKRLTKVERRPLPDPRKPGALPDILLLLGSGAAVAAGAHYLVREALFFAGALGLPQAAIGLFVAIGTTIPELSVAIAATRSNKGGIAIGNAIGSCITNLSLIMGISALIGPLTASRMSTLYIAPFMVLLGITLLHFMRTGWRIYRREGAVLVGSYLLFLLLVLAFA